MGLSARTPTTAKTNLFIPANYSMKVEEAVKSELVAWGAFDTDRWGGELVKGDIVYIPKDNNVTATEVVVGTKASATNPLNTTGVTLTINQWYEAPVDIDDMTKRQQGANTEAVAVDRSKYAVKKAMDSSVCALFSSLGGYSTSAYGTDGQLFTDDLALYLFETLKEADVPDGETSVIVDPSCLVDMLKIDKLVATTYAANGANLKNGVIGQNVYGATVRMTNNLAAATIGNYAVWAHKRAIAGAAQIDKAWMKVYEDLHQTRYQSEALWGVIELNDAFGIPFFTRKS
jgi:hypothetical protein